MTLSCYCAGVLSGCNFDMLLFNILLESTVEKQTRHF
jgi:hypothetical protein